MNPTPYWMPHLCKLMAATERAEERRVAAQAALLRAPSDYLAALTLNAAETDLDAALLALHGYYSRLPYPISLAPDVRERMEWLAAAWLWRTPPLKKNGGAPLA